MLPQDEQLPNTEPPADPDATAWHPSSDPEATEYHLPSGGSGPVMSAFTPGFVLAGKFRLERQLGRGGMGEAWKAFDTLAERHVVLKFVPKEIQHVKEAMDSVKDSFKKVHALQHQHICPVYDLFQDEQHGLCLVMKFIDGMPLDEYRRRLTEKNKALSFSDLVQILWGVAQGLDYAHEKKVIHRDIKPQNIMVGKTDGVQIIDFGLAEEIRTSMVRFSEVSMDVAGTRPYMAPEQWQGKYQDAKTDQYALAVTAYELFSGRVPFQGGDVGVLRECVLHDAPDPIPNLPDYINNAVLKALSKKREDRFENCKAFIRAMTSKPKKNVVPPQIVDESSPQADAVMSMPSINLKSEKPDQTFWKPQISTDTAPKNAIKKGSRNRTPLYASLGIVSLLLLTGLFWSFFDRESSKQSSATTPTTRQGEKKGTIEKKDTSSPPQRDLSVLSADEKRALQQKYPEFDWSGANVVVLPEPSEDALRKAFKKAAETPESDFIVVRTTKDDHRIVMQNDVFEINHKASEKGAVTLIGLGPEKLILDGNKKYPIIRARSADLGFAHLVFANGYLYDENGTVNVGKNATLKIVHCDFIDNVNIPDKKTAGGTALAEPDFAFGIDLPLFCETFFLRETATTRPEPSRERHRKTRRHVPTVPAD